MSRAEAQRAAEPGPSVAAVARLLATLDAAVPAPRVTPRAGARAGAMVRGGAASARPA